MFSITEEVAMMAEDYGISESTIMEYSRAIIQKIKESYGEEYLDKDCLLECLENVVSMRSSIIEDSNHSSSGRKLTLEQLIDEVVESKFNPDYNYEDKAFSRMTEKDMEYFEKKLEPFYNSTTVKIII